MRVGVRGACGALAAVGLASRALAQPVLGPGDDATLPARGEIRARSQLVFTAAGERAGGATGGGSGRVAIASEFSLDSITPAQFPGLTAARDALRDATGLRGLGLSLGTLAVRARVNTTRSLNLVEFGVLPRVAVSVLLPFIQTRTTVDASPNPGGGAGNFGINPTLGSGTAATAAQVQTRDALANLTTAATTARAGCPTASAGAACADRIMLATTAEQLRAQLGSVYGTGVAGSGSLVVPLANSDAQRAVTARIAALGAQFAAAGVTGVSAAAVPAPSLARIGAPALLTLLTAPAYGVGFNGANNPLGPQVRASTGDVELAASVNLLDSFGVGRDGGRRARTTPAAGLRVRSTVTGGFRLATGSEARQDILLDVPPAERAAAVLARSATDVAVGRRLSASVVARAALPLADRRTLRLPLAAGQPFSPNYAFLEVGRKLGREVELEVTPRYALGESFAVAAQGMVRHRAAARYTGTYALTAAETGGDPVTLDAAALGVGSGGREARFGVGASYSTVAAAARRPGRLPVEVSFLHSATLAASGGAVPYTRFEQLSLRVYARLLGR